MRVFIGVFMPKEACEKIKKLQKELERQKLFIGGFTKADNMHLTIKFLGDVDEKKVTEMRNRLKAVNLTKFKASLKEGGVFTDQRIRILWVRTEGFERLQQEIDEVLAMGGLFKREERFMGHLTIARVKDCKKENREKLLEQIKKVNLDFEFEVGEVCLIKSILKPEGPEYKILEKIKLV